MVRDRLIRRLRAVRRAVLARRRLLAAALAAVAVAGGVHAAGAPTPPGITVLTAARDLPAGAVLGSDDVVETDFAPGSVPANTVSADVIGQALAAAVRRGEPLTDVRLVGPALTTGDPSRTALPVRLPDAGMVGLLAVGDRIDLIATDPQGGGAHVVAAGVTVLAIPTREDEAVAGQPGALIVVGAAPTDITALADAGVRYFLTFAFTR